MNEYLRYHCPSEIADFWKHYIKDLHLDSSWTPDVQAEIDRKIWMENWEIENSGKMKIEASKTFGSQGYQCVKCFQFNVKMETNQTRSLDERSIQYFFCLNPTCKHTWRE
jgi:DNA-directed RNA polymerase subunit M/transcription elongation factor TFIIS